MIYTRKEVCSGKSMPSVFRCGSSSNSSNQSRNLGPGNGDEIRPSSTSSVLSPFFSFQYT
ncbi:hypothetical protein TYRP_005807 [Tyrophagus putrescentiae]|nr:hypothetical protein TYRP_005807 [Tyrophagus putrescentiae]